MWKDIIGFEGKYQVSDNGEVKSLERHIENGSDGGMTLQERILKQTRMPNGYMQVALMNAGVKSVRYVHRLVAEAFLENTSNLPTVNHINGDKSDNRVCNLEYASYGTNNQHAYDTGLHGRGERHYGAKLRLPDVKMIREKGKYASYEAIGNEYGVSKATVRDVLLHRTWAFT